MRVLFATASLATVLLTVGCSEPDSPAGPSTQYSNVDVPFKGDLEGSVTVTPLPPGRGNVQIDATGNATHLGRFTLQIPHIVTFATRIGVGTYVFTAANGDQLFASFSGQAVTSPPMVEIVEHATITGGTGRFADATGSFTVHRVFDQTAGWTVGSVEGTISY
jgi:hypothetical protein